MLQFFLRIGIAPTPLAIRLNRVTSKNAVTSLKNCLSTFKFFALSCFPHSFVHFDKKWNQPEENLNHRLNKVERKFAKIQIAFDFVSVLILRDHSKWRANKNEYGDGIMLIQTFVLKVINNGRKKLTHHEIIDRIVEPTVSVITQACKESNLWIHPNLRQPRFSFSYSFNFTYNFFVRLAFHSSYERY